MDYQEFADLVLINDDRYPFLREYELDDGSRFMIEPAFYTQFLRFGSRYPERISDILKEMKATVKRNHRVIFSGNYDLCPVDDPEWVIREIKDITDELKIFVDDISRGSDYGD